MKPTLPEVDSAIRHYIWAGLDFMFDSAGVPVFLEANRCSHMLGEYLAIHGNDAPFRLTAEFMNAVPGVPCLLWRRGEPFPNGDEDAPFIARHLTPHLRRPPVVCDVEDNQEPRETLVTRDGSNVRPGSIFRWWYGLPWSHERFGTRVVNSNAAWVVVRDKFLAYRTLSSAAGPAPASFRVPHASPVESAADAERILKLQPEAFPHGYVLKPRVGWGGQGVQIADPGESPRPIPGNYVLCERILPPRVNGLYWEVRMFVMAGVCLGGIRHVSRSPHTNYWQGGRPEPVPHELNERLCVAAFEAVTRLEAAAEQVHRLPVPPESQLTQVDYRDALPPSGTPESV